MTSSQLNHTHSGTCSCPATSTTYTQSLSELDFERSLHHAASNGNLSLAEKRISSLSTSSHPPWLVLDASGYTPLHYAARGGHLSMCEFLLSLEKQHSCMSPSALQVQTPETKATPLHRACFTGNKDIISLFVKEGASLSSQDIDGRTPYDIFCKEFPRDKEWAKAHLLEK